MNWDAIGAIGQMLGSVAVFVTLGYLAMQTRVAHTVASDTNRQQRAQGAREMLLTLATDEDLRSLWDRTVDDQTDHAAAAIAARLGVTKDEAHRLSWACQYWCWLHWGQWGSMTTDDDVAELQHLIQTFYSTPPMSVFWALSPYVRMLDRPFVEFVNAALASASAKEQPR